MVHGISSQRNPVHMRYALEKKAEYARVVFFLTFLLAIFVGYGSQQLLSHYLLDNCHFGITG